MSFDLDTILRTHKPQRRTRCPAPRSPEQLPWARNSFQVGGPLLLDTTVYIDVLRGRAPPEVITLLRLRTCNHSSVCLAELTHAFGRLDPGHPDTKSALAEIRGTIRDDIRPHRLHAPDAEVWASAGMLAGLVSRLRNLAKGHDHRILNDAMIYLQACKLGCAVLTRNITDFDLLEQLAPMGEVLFYQ